MPSASQEEIKLNLGCGGRPLSGYVNVDSDSIEAMKARYPSQIFAEDAVIFDYDIFHLPFPDASVSEVRADAFFEHLNFMEESKLFYEVKRVLRPGGVLNFSVPDFEEIMKMWLAAKDDWKDFYRTDDEAIASDHWFGQYSWSMETRWGYLMASIFGNQNGAGQFHKNCYTVPKIRAILDRLDFEESEISQFLWKGARDPMISVQAIKR